MSFSLEAERRNSPCGKISARVFLIVRRSYWFPGTKEHTNSARVFLIVIKYGNQYDETSMTEGHADFLSPVQILSSLWYKYFPLSGTNTFLSLV